MPTNDLQAAFTMYEKVFLVYKNSIESQSNQLPIGNPNRIEYDLKEIEKAHLDLLRTRIDIKIAENHLHLSDEMNKLMQNNLELSKKMASLTKWVVILTFVSATSAFIQVWPILKNFFMCV
jgi:hypothetical protein